MDRFLQINTISLAVFGISIFGIFKWFYEKIKKLFEQQQRERKLLDESTVAILHNKIYKNGMAYIEQGYITVEELQDLEKLFNPYDAMGQNGTARIIIEKVRKLPIRKGYVSRVMEKGDDVNGKL